MRFTVWQRVQLEAIGVVGWLFVRLIGLTLRYQVENWEAFETARQAYGPLVFSFFHNQILAGMYFFRGRDIVVMTSSHFDGEAIARVTCRFGYGAARGSSTRGGVRALLELKKYLQKGQDVAFTVDGPRGPVYQVKPGPVWLAKNTGQPIFPFHVEPEKAWRLKNWDRFRIPKPFSRVRVLIAPVMIVPEDADEQEWNEKLQKVLNDLRQECEAYWAGAAAPRRQ